jgi:hypothetical protein
VKIRKLTLLLTAIFISLIMSALYFYFHLYKGKKTYECHANLRHSADTLDGYITSNMNISFIPEDGYFTIIGKITVNNHLYNVHRDGYMVRENDAIEGSGSQVKIVKEVLLPADDVDNDIWTKYFSPRPIGSTFYLEFRPLFGNLYLVTMPSIPLMVCASTEENTLY